MGNIFGSLNRGELSIGERLSFHRHMVAGWHGDSFDECDGIVGLGGTHIGVLSHCACPPIVIAHPSLVMQASSRQWTPSMQRAASWLQALLIPLSSLELWDASWLRAVCHPVQALLKLRASFEPTRIVKTTRMVGLICSVPRPIFVPRPIVSSLRIHSSSPDCLAFNNTQNSIHHNRCSFDKHCYVKDWAIAIVKRHDGGGCTMEAEVRTTGLIEKVLWRWVYNGGGCTREVEARQRPRYQFMEHFWGYIA